MALPISLICLKSTANNKYLRYGHEDVQTRGLLVFDADSPMDPYAQFEVEKSKTYDDLVHLKSRYTNKYLVRWSPIHEWIAASGYAPDENKRSWTCTLFKPIPTDEGSWTKIRLLHVQLGHYANLAESDDKSYNLCLFVGPKKNVAGHLTTDVFSVTNWDSMFKLPQYVAFKGIENGKYLGAESIGGNPGLKFSFDDPHDPKVCQEIFTYPDGSICIKSVFFGKFWRTIEGQWNWVEADADDPRGKNDVSAIFRPSVLTGNNVVALLCMSNTLFCKRLTAHNRESFLSASINKIDRFTPFEFVPLKPSG